MSVWANGQLKRGFLCPFCRGFGAYFMMTDQGVSFWSCQACQGDGAPNVVAPKTLRLGAAQNKYLKQYPT